MFFDAHAHLTSPELLDKASLLIQRARSHEVSQIVNICTDVPSLEAGLELNKNYPEILNAAATTPHDVEMQGEKDFPIFQKTAELKQLIAIGETGLDYHYEHSNRKLQQEFLVRYLHLAARLQLPIIFHCREAFSDLFSIVDAEYPKKAPAILHCFTGSMEEAEEVCKRGWFLSLSGIVTFKKSEELRKVAQQIPMENLLIETDAPYLAPQSKRGQQNEPAFIAETAACIAAVRGVSLEKLAHITKMNAKRAFQLSN